MLSRGRQGAENLALIERFDAFAGVRNALRAISERQEEWAGMPMPLDGQQLTIEPRYPHAELFKMLCKNSPDEDEPADVTLRNVFWSTRHRAEVYVWNEGGKVLHAVMPRHRSIDLALDTMMCSAAWGIEQEAAALQLLATLVSHHQFKTYLLTGMFIESSQRTRLTYMFRKLRPTIVLDARPEREGQHIRVRCALCMHPIGYYQNSWAGAMTPTDDVISHLMLMRGDEPMFWRRANQHAPHRPEAGL